MKPALTPASPSVPTLRYVIPIVIAINAAVLWLLRDAPYVTGEVIRIDGGRSLGI